MSNKTDHKETFLTVREAGKYADVSEATVRRVLRLIRTDPEKIYDQIPVPKRASLASSPYQLEGNVIRINRLGRHVNSPRIYRISQDFVDSFFDVDKSSVMILEEQDQDTEKRNTEEVEEQFAKTLPSYEKKPVMKRFGRDGLETFIPNKYMKRGRPKKRDMQQNKPIIDEDSLIGLIADMKRQLYAQEYQIKELTQQNSELVSIVRKLVQEKEKNS